MATANDTVAMTDADLEAIEARANAATPHERITYCCYEHGGGRAFVDGESGARHLVMDSYEQPDREFDFSTRSDVPALIAEVRRLKMDGPMAYHVHQEVNEAHAALDRLGAPKTRLVPNRAGDGEQEITLGLKDRIRSLGSKVEPVK